MKKNNRDPSFIRKMRVHTSVVQLHCDSRPGLAVMYKSLKDQSTVRWHKSKSSLIPARTFHVSYIQTKQAILHSKQF